MKHLIIYYSIIFSLFVTAALTAQNQDLEAEKEKITQEEKEALKKTVEKINSQLENEEINFEEAQSQKAAAAERHALNIKNRIAILENKTALQERNQQEGDSTSIKEEKQLAITFSGSGVTVHGDKKRKYDRRTTSDFVLAFGFNNVVTEGESLNDSEFKFGGSRFAELGLAWKTRVFKNSNWLRVKYGFSFQFNGLKPIDNQYFVDTGEETQLEEFPLDLDKSKFRMDNLVLPLHFEFGPSRKIEKEDYFRYSTKKYIKVGLGGYAGINLGTRQKLKYKEEGEKQKDKIKRNYNTNNFVYGLSAYVGWQHVALYAKYDLNPIFKNNPVEQRNISLGLRFDMD